jgi:hypothetical protein
MDNPRRGIQRKQALRLGGIAAAAYLAISMPVAGYRLLGDRRACDEREITSIVADRCMELRRATRIPPFGAWGSSPDIDRVVDQIIAEGRYPTPPHTGPVPSAPDVGPPSTRGSR